MLLEVNDIVKRFYGVTVLSHVNLSFSGGCIHALVGENGAGKSTLMKIIGGIYHADGGSIAVDGHLVRMANALAAAKSGISIVHQEYNLVSDMTVLDNVMLGKELIGRLGKLDRHRERAMIEEIARKDAIKVDLDKYAGDLSSAEAKIAEILRACSNDMELLILDEPTAALDDEDVAGLFSLIRNLKERGVGIIYISHRLDEVFELCDKVSVLKDGKLVGTWDCAAIDRDFLVKAMVGREITAVFPPRPAAAPPGNGMLEVEGLSDPDHFHSVSLRVCPGEIVGIGGMSGHGQRELLRALFGITRTAQGSIRIDGRPVVFKHPADALRHGLAFLSDDRRNEGLAQQQSVARNIAYPSLGRFHARGIVRGSVQHKLVQDLVTRLDIKLASHEQRVQNLSGGNQQRVVLAKWLPLNPRVLLLDEPTLGVDVGAKVEIYRILRELVAQGIAIVMVTSDMLELLNMSDRILVFYEGRIVAEYRGETATEEIVMAAASGRPVAAGVVS
jgi:ribose transport system ATP-binding protein